MEDVRPERLNLIRLDLTSEESISSAANDLAKSLKHQCLVDEYPLSVHYRRYAETLKAPRRPDLASPEGYFPDQRHLAPTCHHAF